jgi:hypothetical protein
MCPQMKQRPYPQQTNASTSSDSIITITSKLKPT